MQISNQSASISSLNRQNILETANQAFSDEKAVHFSKKINDSIKFVKKLKNLGFDYVCVSSGGIIPITNLRPKKAFRKNLCKKIKSEVKIITRSSGQIDDFKTIDDLLENKSLDLVATGRKFINDPHWLIREAKKRKLMTYIPQQYNRCI